MVLQRNPSDCFSIGFVSTLFDSAHNERSTTGLKNLDDIVSAPLNDLNSDKMRLLLLEFSPTTNEMQKTKCPMMESPAQSVAKPSPRTNKLSTIDEVDDQFDHEFFIIRIALRY